MKLAFLGLPHQEREVYFTEAAIRRNLYADTAALADHPRAREAHGNESLRDRVVEWKSRFFGSSWANYNQAKPGTFRLVPVAGRISALRRDYQAMGDMYLVDPPDFEEVIQKLAVLENKINRSNNA
jgi:hypothetical protein